MKSFKSDGPVLFNGFFAKFFRYDLIFKNSLVNINSVADEEV